MRNYFSKYVLKKVVRFLRWSEKLTRTDVRYVLASNFWLNFGRLISISTGLVLTAAFANMLSPEVFGTYKYVLAAAGTINAFTLNGMGNALLRAVAQKKEHVVPYAVRVTMLWSIPASLASSGISIYYFWHNNEVLGWGFLFIAIYNVLANGYGLAKSVLLATGKFKKSLVISLPRSIFPVLVILITLLISKNIVWILLAYFTSNIIGNWVMYRWTLRTLNIKASKKDFKETLTLGKHMSVLGFFMLLSGQIDQLLLFHFSGSATLAIYALAIAPLSEARTLLDNSTTILFPRLAARSKEDARASISFRVKQMFVVSAVATCLYILFIPILFELLFPKYLPSVLATQVMALTLLFEPRGILDAYIFAHGEIKERYKWILSSQAVEFVLYLVLIPLFGLWGAVAATVLSEIGAAGTLFVVYKRM